MPFAMQDWVAETFLPKLFNDVEFPSLHQTILGLRKSAIEQEGQKHVSCQTTIDDLDHFGYTALAWAARRSDLLSVKKLLEYAELITI